MHQKHYSVYYYITIVITNSFIWMPIAASCCSIIINQNVMNKDVKTMKSAAEEAIEEILVELETRGVKVFRLQVFTGRDRPPQVNIVVDEMGGNR